MRKDQKKFFENFYQKHFDRVYRYIFFRIGQNRSVAEDLVSEIFFKALEHFDSYDASRSEFAWIMTIAGNHLKNYYRDHKITVSLDAPAATEDMPSAPDTDARWLPQALIAGTAEESRLTAEALIAKLPTALEQEIVTFHYLFGYTYKEIAAEKGISEGSVKLMAHRALKKLRAFL